MLVSVIAGDVLISGQLKLVFFTFRGFSWQGEGCLLGAHPKILHESLILRHPGIVNL